MNKRQRYGPLAKALMTAFMAHRLGTKIATQEKSMRDFPIEDVGALWLAIAEIAETLHTQQIDRAMTAINLRAGQIQ